MWPKSRAAVRASVICIHLLVLIFFAPTSSWVLLVNKSRACGLAMVPEGGGAGYGFSASKFSVETLDRTMHEHDLVPAADERVHVHLDGFCMGVGGYDSWSPNVDRQFRVDPATDRQALETCVTLMAVADVQE